MQLALPRPLRVADGVVSRGRFGQTCQHRHLRQGELVERFGEISLRGRGKTVGLAAEENLIHVKLQNLVLAHLLLDLQRQQHLEQLAGEGLFARQIKIARHLHGDGRGALTARPLQIRQQRASHSRPIDAAMLIETVVFGGQHRLFHQIGNLPNGRKHPALLAELAQQHVVRRIHPQRQLGLIVLQFRDVGQSRPAERQHQPHDQRGRDQQPYDRDHQADQGAQPPRRASARARRRRGRGGRGGTHRSGRTRGSAEGLRGLRAVEKEAAARPTSKRLERAERKFCCKL